MKRKIQWSKIISHLEKCIITAASNLTNWLNEVVDPPKILNGSNFSKVFVILLPWNRVIIYVVPGENIRLTIYINKVAVCVCLSGTFSFTIVTITKILVQTFTTRAKTTKSITYFCFTITQVLVQTHTTRGKQLQRYSSSIPTGTTAVLDKNISWR